MKEQLGEKVKQLRNDAGLSKRDLAAKADVAYIYINSLELGKGRVPSKTILRALSLALTNRNDAHLLDEFMPICSDVSKKDIIALERRFSKRMKYLKEMSEQKTKLLIDDYNMFKSLCPENIELRKNELDDLIGALEKNIALLKRVPSRYARKKKR